MKQILKKYPRKTINFFRVFPFPGTPIVKCPLSYGQSTSWDHKIVTSPCVLVVKC